MLNVVHLLDDIQELDLSNSTLMIANSCERKFFLQWLLKLLATRPEEFQGAALIGLALHAGYETYLNTGSKTQATFAFLQKFPIELVIGKNDRRSLENCIATLDKLFETPPYNNYTLATITDAEGDVHKATEVGFRCRIENFSLFDHREVPVYFRGCIDKIIGDPIRDKSIIGDLKTHTQSDIDAVGKYYWANQTTGYGIVWNLFNGRPIDTEFDLVYVLAKIHLLHPEVKTQVFRRKQQQINEWKAWLRRTLLRIKQNIHDAYFMRNSNSCITFNRRCLFFDQCGHDDEYLYAIKAKNTHNYFDDITPLITTPINIGF